jgi:hypothetical protein
MEKPNKQTTSKATSSLDEELALIEQEEASLAARIAGQKAKVLGRVVTELAKQLDAAGETYKKLIARGQTDVLKDPQFADVVKLFGIGTKNKPASSGGAGSSGGTKFKSGELQGYITKLLTAKSDQSHAEIKAGIAKESGREVGNQFILLARLVEEKILTKDGEGKKATYSIKK